MHVIAKKAFDEAQVLFPNDKEALAYTYSTLKRGTFTSPEVMKKTFKSLDFIKGSKNLYVINIGGNNLRLILGLYFRIQKAYVRDILSHADYSKKYCN